MGLEISLPARSGERVVIRGASWRDLPSVRALEQRCFPQDAWPLWDIIAVLALPNVVRLKALADETLVGFIAGEVHSRDRVAWISTVGVLPEYRGQGVGAALMQACEERLPSRVVRLSVRRSNLGAIRLYEKLGYHTLDTWGAYYPDGEDALVLEKLRDGSPSNPGTVGAPRDRRP